MSNPFEYDYNKELYKPLTKYQALKLAATLMSLPNIDLDFDDGKYAENQIGELFSVAEQILEKDAALINELLESDKRLAYDLVCEEKQKA